MGNRKALLKVNLDKVDSMSDQEDSFKEGDVNSEFREVS